MEKLTKQELRAWNSFVSVVRGFLGNKMDEYYEQLVHELLDSYQSLVCRMSQKIHYLHSRKVRGGRSRGKRQKGPCEIQREPHQDRGGIAQKKGVLLEERKILRRQIVRSKDNCWRKLIEELNDDIWGKGYQIVRRTLKGMGQPTLHLTPQKVKDLIAQLFPNHTAIIWDKEETIDLIQVSLAELKTATSKLKPKKGPRTRQNSAGPSKTGCRNGTRIYSRSNEQPSERRQVSERLEEDQSGLRGKTQAGPRRRGQKIPAYLSASRRGGSR